MLFCLTANYTPKGLDAMRDNPNTNRREAVEQLVAAAGGKLVAMYGTMADGPGAMGIFDADPVAAGAITGTIASSTPLRTSKCNVFSPGKKWPPYDKSEHRLTRRIKCQANKYVRRLTCRPTTKRRPRFGDA